MKKFLSILMSLIMCFSLVACGSKEKYEMTGIYLNNKWYKTDDENYGTLELDNSDWTTGRVTITIGGETNTIELSNKSIDDEYTFWDGKNGSASFRVLAGRNDDGSINIVINRTGSSTMLGFKFDK